MAFIEILDLEKRYSAKGKLVVDHMNLAIEKGEFLVLLGPSGCGKTTTIRMISGLEEISGGDIRIEGKSIAHLLPRERGVSMVFQSYAIWPHMTVYENIAYPLRLQKLPKAEIDARVQASAERTHITEYLKRYPAQLSGGQRQRVAVSRAIVVQPKIFLMDEPLSNLDAMLRVSMRTELKKIHEALGTTSIFVTHDQTEAMSLADRIVIMKDGKIEQIGTPNQVYFDCETMFVASFIGTPPTNFFSLTMTDGPQGPALVGPALRYALTADEAKTLAPYRDKTVVMGVRPENLEISTQPIDHPFFSGKADFIEPQGSHLIVISMEPVALKISTFQLDLKVKADIYVRVSGQKPMFFDPETQKRIR